MSKKKREIFASNVNYYGDEYRAAAIHRYWKKNGEFADCPSRHIDVVEKNGKEYFILENSRGRLAKYSIDKLTPIVEKYYEG